MVETQNVIFRRDEVERITGLSRSGIYARVKKGSFPPPIRLGARSVGWLSSEIEKFIADRVAARDQKKGGEI